MRRHELAYLRLERSSLLAVTSQLEIEVQLTVDSLQLDQQLPGACYPVALQGLGGSQASGRAAAAAVAAAAAGGGVAEDAPWLQLRLSRRRQEKRLRAVDLRLGEVRLYLEEALLAALYAFAQRAVPAPITPPAAAPTAAPAAAAAAPASPWRGDGAAAPPPLMTSLAEPSLPTAARKRPWYIDEVQLSALRIQVSYRARPAGAAGEGDWRVPLALPNLEGYSLELASKRLVNFFISRRRLLEDFGKHYKGEVLRNLFSGKVLPRHANAPAAPATLHAHATVASPEVPQAAAARLPLFPPALTARRHEPPLPALTTHYLPPTADGPTTYPLPTPYLPPTYPTALLRTQVLLHADLSSVVSDKVASMTGGHGRGAATSSLSAPADGKDGKPRHVAEGVLQGGLGLGRGIFSGITGLVAAPLSGAREGAAEGRALAGFARGLGRGLVGAAVKPTAGVLGLAAKTAEGLRRAPRCA